VTELTPEVPGDRKVPGGRRRSGRGTTQKIGMRPYARVLRLGGGGPHPPGRRVLG